MRPRSSGKTALLQEILHNSNFDIPPSYLNGRSGQLSEESVLVRLLQEKGATALQKLSVVLKDFANTSIGRASTAVSIQPKGDTDSVSSRRDKVVAAFLQGDSQRMSDVIEVYNDMLELTKTRKLPPPRQLANNLHRRSQRADAVAAGQPGEETGPHCAAQPFC